jgi:hypothetical protein
LKEQGVQKEVGGFKEAGGFKLPQTMNNSNPPP